MDKLRKSFLIFCAVLTAMFFTNACVLTRTEYVAPENNTVSIETVETDSSLYDDPVKMLEKTRPSVLEVYATSNGRSYSAGSGVIFAKDKKEGDAADGKTRYYILTCHHVIDETSTFAVKDIAGNQYSVELIGGDPLSDIAVLRMCPQNDGFDLSKILYSAENTKGSIAIANLRVPSSETQNYLKVGETVYAIGNPLGTLGGTVTKGIISSTNRKVTVENRVMTLIQTDCAINSGNSGGGLFDGGGNLAGIVNAGYSGSVEGLNFAIPSDVALEKAEPLVKTYTGKSTDESGGYGYIEGNSRIIVANENSQNAPENYDFSVVDYYTTGGGIFGGNTVTSRYPIVYRVTAGSLFDGKLEKGDKITDVDYDGKTYETVANSSYSGAEVLLSTIGGLDLKAGKKIIFTVTRNNVSKKIEITLTQYYYKP